MLIDIAGHVDVPGTPGPFPAWIWDLCICDIHGASALILGHPGGGVEVEEGAMRVKRDAEEEPATLIFVENVQFGEDLGFIGGSGCLGETLGGRG